MKVVVIGCTHAGTAASLNIAKLYPEAEVTVYERNDNVSFLSCGIALYIGGVIADPNGLFYSSPKELADAGVKTKMKHEVLSVDINAKTLKVKNLETGEEFEDNYDKLVATIGSWPIQPPIEGSDLENVVLCKNWEHANNIIERSKNVEKVVVVGAGYIGVELVEAFEMNGKKVTLIDAEERILSKYLDKEYTDMCENTMKEKGITIATGEMVQKLTGEDGKVKAIHTTKGAHEADMVVLCIGFRPNTNLLKGQVEMLGNGAIIVDEYMQTSVKDVYAAGDCCSIHYNPTDSTGYIPLATNAVRMGTLVAKNLMKPTVKHMGTQGTSGIKIYEHNISSTGLTEARAKAEGINTGVVSITDNNKPEFMPHYDSVKLKLVYDKDSRRVLGGQITSLADVTQMMNTLSVVIQNKMTVEELAFTDFFFQPHYGKAWNLLNIAALAAE